jgi:hypothetical protein
VGTRIPKEQLKKYRTGKKPWNKQISDKGVCPRHQPSSSDLKNISLPLIINRYERSGWGFSFFNKQIHDFSVIKY